MQTVKKVGDDLIVEDTDFKKTSVFRIFSNGAISLSVQEERGCVINGASITLNKETAEVLLKYIRQT